MCKLGMYTTKMFSVLVAMGTVVSCPTYAADRAVIEVRGDSKAEVMWFRSGAEQNIPYTISRDGGRTWSEVRTTHFAKGIRNMQFSGKLGQWYFMQGRSGSNPRQLVGDDPGPDNFVLYSSRDGIQWDEGIVLMSRLQTPGGGDCYSANEIIGKYNPATPQRLLIHSDVSYSGANTNMHQWWVTTAPWMPGLRVGPTEGKDANGSPLRAQTNR